MLDTTPDKELFEDIIKFLDLLSERGTLAYHRAQVLLGGLSFVRIHDWLQSHIGEAFLYDPRSMCYILRDRDHLDALRYLCEKEIARIERAERDYLIDTNYKIKGILYGRISLIISGLAFLLSLWTTLRQAGIF